MEQQNYQLTNIQFSLQFNMNIQQIVDLNLKELFGLVVKQIDSSFQKDRELIEPINVTIHVPQTPIKKQVNVERRSSSKKKILMTVIKEHETITKPAFNNQMFYRNTQYDPFIQKKLNTDSRPIETKIIESRLKDKNWDELISNVSDEQRNMTKSKRINKMMNIS